jgi:Holliday junction resolvasome RuvABC ATP-dependent DNA helicase subunit
MSHIELKILKNKNRIALLSMRNKENARIVAKLVRRVRNLESRQG